MKRFAPTVEKESTKIIIQLQISQYRTFTFTFQNIFSLKLKSYCCVQPQSMIPTVAVAQHCSILYCNLFCLLSNNFRVQNMGDTVLHGRGYTAQTSSHTTLQTTIKQSLTTKGDIVCMKMISIQYFHIHITQKIDGTISSFHTTRQWSQVKGKQISG